MPRMIAEKLHTKLKGEGLNEYFLDFEKDIHQLYTYKGGVSLQHPEIVVPERKIIRVPDELKNDIKVVTHSLVDKVALRPEILQEITPRQFEELVCELFERKGYNVQLTKQTRDGGKDLIVLNNSMLGDLVIYAECKKKAPKHPVNVGLVRQLYGTVEADRVTAGIMVTNSYFSEDARRFQQTIKSRMNLIDYSELMKQIMDCR
jgi:restriction endonuclease Mrr